MILEQYVQQTLRKAFLHLVSDSTVENENLKTTPELASSIKNKAQLSTLTKPGLLTSLSIPLLLNRMAFQLTKLHSAYLSKVCLQQQKVWHSVNHKSVKIVACEFANRPVMLKWSVIQRYICSSWQSLGNYKFLAI